MYISGNGVFGIILAGQIFAESSWVGSSFPQKQFPSIYYMYSERSKTRKQSDVNV